MATFLVYFAASTAVSWALTTLFLNYRRDHRERIQAPIAAALWAEGDELRRELRREAEALRAEAARWREEGRER